MCPFVHILSNAEGQMSRDTSAILASPTDCGFEFVTGKVSVGGQGDKAEAVFTVPLVRVIDVEKFEAEFPGVIIAALDGTSIRVASQRICRDACEKQPMLERQPDELKLRLVNGLKGVRVSTPRALVFGGPGGLKFATEAEAAEAWKTWASQK